MAICLENNGSGFVVMNPQPSEYTTCTYVLQSGSELHAGVLNITPAEGLQLSGAIVAVWAIGFVIRMGIKATNVDEKESQS